MVGGAVRDELLGARARRPRHRRARSTAGGPRLRRGLRRRALRALRAARRLARRVRGRPHGRLHAAARLDRGRPGEARLHDQCDCPTAGRRASPSTRSTGLRRPRSARAPCGSARASSSDDPLRLLRAVRLEDELELRLDEETERLVRRDAELVTRPAGERIVAELRRLSAGGYRRLDALGLLAPLGGRIDDRLDRWDSPDFRLVAVFGDDAPPPAGLERAAPLRRRAAACRAARAGRARDPPLPPRRPSRGRSRRSPSSEPRSSRRPIEEARAAEPAEPLLRGDELDLPPGPEIGRLLAEIEEERAAGTIATREEALDYARRNAGAVRQDG